ncbi:alpha/beta hydrolase [Aliiglaciecola sp. NS0011-25]|uniref:alpha/beta fold hydrolase n=1 Tax=Aliiglaciecola sp. NS0011-25 TaxID=3127654 RepID=UPI0033408B55
MKTNSKIHFAHANGFPAGSYRVLLDSLSSQHQVIAIDKLAHNPNFPVDFGWQNQVAELVEYLHEKQAEPCYLVGHSFGAVVSFLTACQHPKLVKGLVLLDPPLITGLTSLLFKSVRRLGLADRLSPAKQAMNRCTTWSKDTDVESYFKGKALFKDMHPECIADYVSSAVKETPDAFKLDFDHRIEANIFRTIPLNMGRYKLPENLPAMIITGEKTKVCKERLIAPFIKKNKLEHLVVKEGGHMFPLEQPNLVAELINQKIAQWESMKEVV